MALTITPVTDSYDVWGKHRVRIFDVAADNSYTTGGYSFAEADVGFKRVVGVETVGGNVAAAALIAAWDSTNKKLLYLYPSGGGAASPAALADPAVAAGAVTMTSAAANGSSDLVPGRGKEVANATDLSTITTRLLVIGE